MPIRNLANLFAGWERELQFLLETGPTHNELWDYWREREEAVERLALSEEQATIDAAFERLFSIAESHGYVRIPDLSRPSRRGSEGDPSA